MMLATAYRITCDLPASQEVADKVCKQMSEQNSSDYEQLLGRTCKLSYVFLIKRKLRLIFGIESDTFEVKQTDSLDEDDYQVKMALELYCRASEKMSFMQRIIYSLYVLDDLPSCVAARIAGVSETRVFEASEQAENEIKAELRVFDREGDYKRYLDFIRKVTWPQVHS